MRAILYRMAEDFTLLSEYWELPDTRSGPSSIVFVLTEKDTEQRWEWMLDRTRSTGTCHTLHITSIVF